MKKVLLAVMPILLLLSCGNRAGKSSSQTDSSLYLNDSIQLGDTAMNLVGKGWLVPDTKYDGYFDLMNKSLVGVSFETARATTKDGRINGFSYISKSFQSKDVFQGVTNKLFVALCKEYGKPTKDSSYLEKDDAGKHHMHDYIWESKNRCVSVTIHRSEWTLFGGDDTYSVIASVDIQDSIVKKKHLSNLFYK